MENKGRESFASRMGFILVSAGCAIGLGNVWKFPYVAGQNGGAVFVVFYIIFLLIMGIPILTAELAIGRASSKTIVEAYHTLEGEGSKWHIHGWLCVLGNYLLMMYYTTVAGWILVYFWKFLSGGFEGVGTECVGAVFENMLASPLQMTVFMAIVVVGGFAVLSFGVQRGLERVNKIMMIGLLMLIVILAINSIILPGGEEGLRFYLLPDIGVIKDGGLGRTVTAAMNQSFFTLSLGIGSMEVFGSYMSGDRSIAGESVRICILDTVVAILSGLIIFPACFSYGVEVDAGPSLIFVTLPNVFINMPAGRIWGTLFFLFLTFASFSTVTGVFENIVGMSMDNFKWDRKKAVIINCIAMLVLSMPCLLGYNMLSNVHLIGGRDILDSEDFIVSNLLLPAGSLIFLLFCVSKRGWGPEKYLEEVNQGTGIRMSPRLIGYLKYVLPVLILVIFVTGLTG